jgi:hypothetical protein
VQRKKTGVAPAPGTLKRSVAYIPGQDKHSDLNLLLIFYDSGGSEIFRNRRCPAGYLVHELLQVVFKKIMEYFPGSAQDLHARR